MKEFFKYINPEKSPGKVFALISVFSVTEAVIILFQMYYLSFVLTMPFVQSFDQQIWTTYLVRFAGITVLKYIIQVFDDRFLAGQSLQIRSYFYRLMKAKLIQLGPSGIKQYHSGNVSNLFIEALDKVELFFTDYISQMFKSSLIPLSILIIILPIDTLTFVVFLLTAPLIPFFMILIGKQAKKETEKQWITLQRMTQYFLDTIRGLQTLKILNAFEDRMRNIEKISDNFKFRTMKVLRIAFLSALVLEILATISTAIVAVEIGLRLLYARIDFQHAMFILLLAPEFYNPLRQLGARFHAGMDGKEALLSILKFLESKSFISSFSEENNLTSPPTSIRFQNVAFTYPDRNRPALENVSFKAEVGDRIAIVGPSGAGKSTLMALLMKWVEPTNGAILVNDTPLLKVNSRQWWQQFAYLPQSPYLFHESLLYNITLGDRNISQESVARALKIARLEKLIEDRENGLYEIIGEDGLRLSGGERQRLALARILVHDFSILVLDEPTAQLDYETEELIFQFLKEQTKDKITFLIAHRGQLLEFATKILVLQNGKTEFFGSREEAIKQSAYVQKMMVTV